MRLKIVTLHVAFALFTMLTEKCELAAVAINYPFMMSQRATDPHLF